MAILLDKSVLCPIVVGRSNDLDAVAQHLQLATNGQGPLLLLAGEAGLGKSRLVSEAKRLAEVDRFSIAQGNCFESDRVLPYALLLDLLQRELARAQAETLAALEPVIPDLIKLLPGLGRLATTASPAPPLEPDQEKRRYFEALALALNRLGPPPRLLVLEDLHWCDDTSLEFLLYFVRRRADDGSLLLLTYRPDEVQANPALQTFLAELGRLRLATELHLHPLITEHVAQMIRAIFEQPTPVQAEFVETLQALTEGNPFFVEETLKALVISGDIFYSPGGWTRRPIHELRIPQTIADAVQRRSGQLSEAGQQLLAMAAVSGRRFDFELLAYLTQHSEASLLKLIKELIAAQLVVEESEDHFMFRHALTQQAIYSGLLARERRAKHRQIAEALETLHGESMEGYLTDLAQHTYAAGLWQKALHYARLAGEKAQYHLYAPRAAREHYTQALLAAGHLGQPLPLDLLRERGQLQQTLGEFDPARADYEQLLAEARARADTPLEWQALIDLGFLWVSRDHARAGDYFRQALALVPALTDPAKVAHTLNRVGNWHLNLAQPHEALPYHNEALRIFESMNDSAGLAATHDLLGITYLVGSNLPGSAAHYDQAVALYQALQNKGGLASSLVIHATRGADYLNSLSTPVLAPWAERLRDAEQALAIAQEMRTRPAEAMGTLWLGLGLGAAGDYGPGLEYLRKGLELAEAIDHQHFMATAHMLLGMFYVDVLAYALAREHLTQALRLAQETGSHVWVGVVTAYLADVETQTGNLAQAEAILEPALPPHLPLQTVNERHLWRAKAELYLAQGRPLEALNQLQQLIEAAPHGHERTIPRLSLLQGQALLALRRYTLAETALQRSLESAEAQGLPGYVWRCQLALSRLAGVQGQRDQAEVYWRQAQTLLDTLAAKLALSDSGLAQNLLRAGVASSGQPPQTASPRAAAKLQYGGLTAREREVAALIAQGKPNREIAESLVLSNRTVEAHISNILSKLDFNSRSQIAVWAVEKGLGAGHLT